MDNSTNFADIQKVVDRFLWNFWSVGCLSSNKSFDFGAEPDHGPGPVIFEGIFLARHCVSKSVTFWCCI